GDAERTLDDTTLSLGLSEDGHVLGSLPYMAPEQLEGKPVDARPDLFALGTVLYEMATGERPFRGDSKASLIVAILCEEPVPPTVRQPLTPRPFDRTIKRCLAKAPDERWQTGADLAAQLTDILDTLHERPGASGLARRWKRSLVIIFATLATAVGLAAIGLTFLTRARTSLPSFERLTFRRGVITAA